MAQKKVVINLHKQYKRMMSNVTDKTQNRAYVKLMIQATEDFEARKLIRSAPTPRDMG